MLLVYVHMYAAYDTRRPICDSDFLPSSHLSLVVYMYPSRFATSDARFATAIFSIWDPKNRMTSEFRCTFTKY